MNAEPTRREIEAVRRRLRAKRAQEKRRLGTLRTGHTLKSLRLAGVDEDLLAVEAELEEDL